MQDERVQVDVARPSHGARLGIDVDGLEECASVLDRDEDPAAGEGRPDVDVVHRPVAEADAHPVLVERLNKQPRVDDRLHLMLWELAERHGETQGDDGQLDVPLTHAVLAELVAAQRPSVSTALGSLESRGPLVRRAGAGWQMRRPRDAEGDGRESGEDRLPGR